MEVQMCLLKSSFLHRLDLYLGKKEIAELHLRESVVLKSLKVFKSFFKKYIYIYFFFDNFSNTPSLVSKLYENVIYSIGSIRLNCNLGQLSQKVLKFVFVTITLLPRLYLKLNHSYFLYIPKHSHI